MGNSKSSILSQEELTEYTQLTYLTKPEILHILDRFSAIGHEVKTDRLHRYPFPEVLKHFPELKYNPFRDRILHVFSSKNDGSFSFEDMLDFCSALSANCPEKARAFWAFKMFDFDGDNQLNETDIIEIITRLTTTKKKKSDARKSEITEDLTTLEKHEIAKALLNDMDLDKTGGIASLEFSHAISKIPEFTHTFQLRF